MIQNRMVRLAIAFAVLFSLVLASGPAAAQGFSELFTIIGDSAVMKRVVADVFGGRDSPEVSRLLSLPPNQRGRAVIKNDEALTRILSSAALTESQQLNVAAVANTDRLAQYLFGLSSLNEANEATARAVEAAAASGRTVVNRVIAESNGGTKRTWSITSPPGDVTIDPSLKVPLFTYKGNQAQIEVSNIPAGKLAAGTVACIVASCIDHVRDYLTQSLNSDSETTTPAASRP
jgi:hypothetical protein